MTYEQLNKLAERFLAGDMEAALKLASYAEEHGPVARDVVGVLGRALRFEQTRDHAAMGLEAIGPESFPVLHQLIRVLQEVDQDEYCINPFVRAIGGIGPRAKRASPHLVDALEHAIENGDSSVLSDLAEALGKIGAKEAVPLLRRLLDPADPDYLDALKSASEHPVGLREFHKAWGFIRETAQEAMAKLT